MAFTQVQLEDIQTIMDAYLDAHRPPEHIRHQLDFGYRIESQSVLLFEIRPSFFQPTVIREEMVAKATYVASQRLWRVYWMRADLKWHSYPPKPTVKTLKAFLALVEKDAHGCFFG